MTSIPSEIGFVTIEPALETKQNLSVQHMLSQAHGYAILNDKIFQKRIRTSSTPKKFLKRQATCLFFHQTIFQVKNIEATFLVPRERPSSAELSRTMAPIKY